MLTGAQCNGICECSNELTTVSDEKCKKVVVEAAYRNDNGCLLIYKQDSVECQDQYADKDYQKFTNVCRRGSISNEHFLSNNDKDVTIESFEQYSTGIESNCTSIGTQTPSVQDANVQTTPSLESLCDSPSELNDKFNSCSHTRIRNFINYSRLDSSTKASSNESSVREESTQYCDSCESEHKSFSGAHTKSHHLLCCGRRDFYHDPFLPNDGFDEECCCRKENFSHKTHRCHCVNEHFYYAASDIRNHAKRPLRINSFCSQDSYTHMPAICHCYVNYQKVNAVPEYHEPKKISVQFHEKPKETIEVSTSNFTAQNHVSMIKSTDCKLEMLDELKSNKKEEKVFKVIKKAKSYDGINLEMEQRKPLLSDLVRSKDDKGNKSDCEGKTLNNDDDDEEEEIVADENEKFKTASECPNGTCHCMHEPSPESLHKNCIQVRPSRKKSSKTSPLKVITFMLFASAFLITGSAIKDAYYQ